MDSPKSPSGSTKRHNRNISHPLPRRSTRGPLDDADDPLSTASQSPSVASPSDVASVAPSFEQETQLPEPAVQEPPPLHVDLHFLKDPSKYHQLGIDDIPTAFLDSPSQPPQDTPLVDLLHHGHFRRAAGTALIELSRCPPDDAVRIFQLLYTRLACLILVSRADLASVEAASLTDFLARNAPGAEIVTPLIPWELRILLVRLQSIAAADGGRRGIMALYALSAEVRAHLKQANQADDQAATALWSHRLRDLGLRVADTLVEMGELETATRHLDTLKDADGDEIAYRKSLLRLRIGDVSGAERCIDMIENTARKDGVAASIAAANGDMATAVDKWRSLSKQYPDDASIPSNLAVGLLYIGKLAEAREVFEDLAAQQPVFPGLLFNLGTVYELCTERALQEKTELAQRVADKAAATASGGWERATFDFKL